MAYNVPLYRRARRGASLMTLYAGFVRTAAIFVLLILAMTPAESYSQEIFYDGTNASVLRPTPDWSQEKGWQDSLFPDASPAEESSGNRITINYDPETGAKKPNSVYGGLSKSGNVTDNTVIVINGDISGLIRGGFTYDGNALRNTVVIHAGSYNNAVHGGYSEYGKAEHNTVTIHGGTFAYNISGGRTGGGKAIHNTVNILGGTVKGLVYGGQAGGFGDVINNTVNIGSEARTGADIYVTGIYGGWTREGKAEGNSVNIVKGNIGASVSGGWTKKGAAAGNKVVMDGGKIAGDANGGLSEEGDAANNTVHISNGEVNGYIHGGLALSGNVTDNTVTISGGDTSGFVYGGRTEKGAASGNKAIVSGGKITDGVSGGYSCIGGVTGSTVDVSGGTIGGYVRGGAAGTGDVTDNMVIVRGGDITGDVIGGWVREGNAAYNEVTIRGGNINGNVYGGHAENGSSTNNTVNISGAPTLSGSRIYGGYGNIGGNSAWTGNTLNFKNSRTIEAAGVGNFEYYNFWLPAGTMNEEKMLVVTDSVEVGDSRVEVLLNGESILHGGDKIALITSTGAVTGETANKTSLSMLGTTVLYEFDISAEGNVLWAKLRDSGHAAPESGALTDSHLVSAALLAQAADMAAALDYIEVSRDKTDSRYVTFAAVNGGSSVYDIGANSELDVDSFLLIAGVMWNVPVRENSLLLRAFAEAGWGGYDTRGSYGGSLVRGSGDSSYCGAGLHARYQWTDADKPDGLYAEASLRAGRVEADFKTADMKNSAGTYARYDTSSTYHSVHVGIGHIWRLNGKTSLDFSSKYLWTHLRGDTFTMATGDRVELGSADSSRWRTGFRAVYDSTEDISLFFGAYYEYEFDGEAAGRVYGTYDIEKASMSGGTGIGELGVIFRPASNDRFSAMLGIQGYVGAREGFSGRLKLQYNM